MAQVITNNLKRSGLFAPIDPAAFIDRVTSIDTPPNFQNWKTINAQALVTGRMTRQGDGHTTYRNSAKACLQTPTTDYLVDLTVPQAVTC